MGGKYVGKGPYDSTTFGKSLSLRVDGGVNAVSINPSGRDVVLANKQGLFIVDLDDPFQPPRLLHHLTSWQVADVQWSPHKSKPYWVISTSNQKAMVWNLARSSSNAIEHVLHGHSRAITDINFHPDHPEILATCSIDTFILAWDMRSPQTPYFKTADWRAGASQVKWNIKNPNVIASSHADYVCVWDVRKGTTPLHTLTGHTSSVNNISFDSRNETQLMTSSNDETVKYWDYEVDSTKPMKTVETDFPVWRGRYLPFGDGSCVIPMAEGGNNIYIMSHDTINNEEKSSVKFQPIYEFKGHKDRVTEFLWRSRHSEGTFVDDREFQLVTWSKDSDLRLWPIPDSVYEKVSFSRKQVVDTALPDFEYQTFRKTPVVKKTGQRPTDLLNTETLFNYPKEKFVSSSGIQSSSNESDNIDHLAWLSGVKVIDTDTETTGNFFDIDDNYNEPSETFKNLGEEFSSVGHKFSKIGFEKISVSTGELVVTLYGPWDTLNNDALIFLRVEVFFPKGYPKKGKHPKFHIEENRELEQHTREEIEKRIEEIAVKYTEKEKHCLEPCLRYLLGEKIDLKFLDQEDETLVDFDVIKKLGLDDELWTTEQTQNSDKEFEADSNMFDREEFDNLDDTIDDNFLKSKVHNSGFDSTPVPKGCGAVWTAQGQLVCFFATSSKSEKQQKVQEKLFKFSASGIRSFGTFKKPSSGSKSQDGEAKLRPKTYLESLEKTINTSRRKSLISTSVENSSDDNSARNSSSDEDDDDGEDEDENFSEDYDGDEDFEEDLDDLLSNDITFRTKIPMVPLKAPSGFDAFSESGRTVDSFKINKNIVSILDFSHIIPDDINLALNYRLMGEAPDVLCKYNATVAEKFGYDDISTCWKIVSDMLLSHSKDIFNHQDWCFDSNGGQIFIKQIFAYYELTKNIQMLAMLACILVTPGVSEKLENFANTDMVKSVISYEGDHRSRSNHLMSPGELSSPFYSKSVSADSNSIRSENYFNFKESVPHSDGIYYYATNSELSNSGASLDEFDDVYNKLPDVKVEVSAAEISDFTGNKSTSLLSQEDEIKLRSYRHQYAELLYDWGLPVHRVKVLKFNINHNTERGFIATLNASDNSDIYRGVESHWIQCTTENEHENVSVAYAKVHNCALCSTPVKKRLFVCNSCQHVMHSACSDDWWKENEECPTGCGCHCLTSVIHPEREQMHIDSYVSGATSV